MSIHKDHRQRLKKRYLDQGLDGFNEIQILELLLFYAIPRIDTNPIAHELINRFGSLAKVLDAPMNRLQEVEGVGPAAAGFLRLVWDINRAYHTSMTEHEVKIQSVADCAKYLMPRFRDRKNEVIFLLTLDAKLKLLGCHQVGEGSINYASIPIRRVVEMALEDGASTVILAHNHPSGIAVPSGDDIQATRRLAAALSAVEITLADHFVVADNDYVSMVQSGYRFDDCAIF